MHLLPLPFNVPYLYVLVFCLLFVVYALFLIYWLIKPINQESASLDRFLVLGGFYLLVFGLATILLLVLPAWIRRE